MDYLSLKNVTKKFGKEKTFALNQVSFDATKSEIVGIIGSSGSGKTTLLRIISGLEIPHSGKIVLNDNILNDTSVFVAPENRNCTLVFQDYALFPHLTVLENINFGKNTSLKPGNVKRLLEIAKIKDLISRYPHEISGGEQQRVALIRAMATNPNLLLLDEPLAHLDYELKEGVRSELMNIFTETDTSVLFVSHDIEDSMKMADKLVVLNKGEVEQIGTPMEIYSHPVNRYVAMLLGKTNLIPRKYYHYCIRPICWMYCFLAGQWLRKINNPPKTDGGPYLYMFNHVSMFDQFMIGAYLGHYITAIAAIETFRSYS